jgi:plasmid stability protein
MKQKSTVVLNCRLPEKLKAELQRRADRQNISTAAMLRLILTKEFRAVKVN